MGLFQGALLSPVRQAPAPGWWRSPVEPACAGEYRRGAAVGSICHCMSMLPNTLGVPCRAERLVVARTSTEMIAALRRYPRDLLLLGGCSNVVLPARLTRPACLVATRSIDIRPDGEDFLVTAAAGESWHGLVRHTLGQGLCGLENLALIPGSVGAAPIQNIGAYGVELAERVNSVRVFDRQAGEVVVLPPERCRFGYRTSVFKSSPNRYAVLALTLRLGRLGHRVLDYPDVDRERWRLGWSQPSPRQIAELVIRVRRRKLPDPRQWGNVGSFFKNPLVTKAAARRLAGSVPGLVSHAVGNQVKLAAAQLIDLCGWKGFRAGAVGVWHRQPLVLVNHGQALGEDFLAVARSIRDSIMERFRVRLELEPTVLGDSGLS